MELNVIEVMTLSGIALLMGFGIHRLIPLTEKYSLPASVLGGLTMAACLALVENILSIQIQLNTSAQTPLMVAFFAALGFGASWQALREGGKKVVWFFLICTGLLLLQNLVGIGVAALLGLNKLFGVVTSSVSLVGGPGTALAFAPLFEASGLESAGTIGITAAMGGILIAGIVGGPVATWLIQKYQLNSSLEHQTKGFKSLNVLSETWSGDQLPGLFKKHLILLLVVMATGAYVAKALTALGLTFPIYIGSMIVAAMIRNWDDRFKRIQINEAFLESLSSAALSLFIAMSLMTLQWSKLQDVAGPILIALIIQTLIVVLFSVMAMFKFYGRNYESAVLCGGMIGFMMGTTANAMANLESVSKKYGPAPFAYFIIPLVGACFIDFANAAVIAFFVNILK